jgi:hypothetical protein
MTKKFFADIFLATTLTFSHDTSIPISYIRLMTELHAVLHRSFRPKGCPHPLKEINEDFMDTLVKEWIHL